MSYEISQRFFFEAAHTLDRQLETENSRRIHGHTYHAEVTVSGSKDPLTGMVLDLGDLRRVIETVRELLDHRFLDEVEGLGAPTLENLCGFIAQRLEGINPPVVAVRVWREPTGDGCRLTV